MAHPITQYILANPIPFFGAIATIYFFFKNKYIHAFYVCVLVMLGHFIFKVIGVTEFMSGVVVGVISNQLFDAIKNKLEAENTKHT